MGLLQRLRTAVGRLPLGERPPSARAERPDDDVLADLAATLDADEHPTWAGWGWAARGAQPDDPLLRAALTVTDAGRVRWLAATPDARPDHADLGVVTQLLVDRKSRRMVLVTDDHHAEHPDVAVVFSFDVDELYDALQAHVPSAPPRPTESDTSS